MSPCADDSRSESEAPVLTGALRAALRCPLSGEELMNGVDDSGRLALISQTIGLAYPVRDGVPILLVHEALRTSVTTSEPQS